MLRTTVTIALLAATLPALAWGDRCEFTARRDVTLDAQALRELAVMAAAGDLVAKIGVLGYTGAVAAYRDGDVWLDALLRYLTANRDFLVEQVRATLPGVRVWPPEATYLAWLDCRGARLPGGDPHTFFLERGKVALNDGRAFGPGGEGFVRLNFACPRALLTEGLGRMRAALSIG